MPKKRSSSSILPVAVNMGTRFAVLATFVWFVLFGVQVTTEGHGLGHVNLGVQRSHILVNSDEDDDDDESDSDDNEVFRVRGVGTIIQRTLTLSTRFSKHVETTDISVAVVSVTFDDNIVLQSKGGSTTDGDSIPIGVADQDFFPEDRLPSAFGVAELHCGARRFLSQPLGAPEKDVLPQGFVVPIPNLLSFPKLEKLAMLIEEVAGEQFSLFSLRPGVATFKGIIIDDYFAKDRTDCKIVFLAPEDQHWTPVQTYVNTEGRTVLPLPVSLAHGGNQDLCMPTGDPNSVTSLISFTQQTEQTIHEMSTDLNGNRSTQFDGAFAAEGNESCAPLPEELFHVDGVTSFLQMGVAKVTGDTEEKLPGLMLPTMIGIMLPIQKLLASLFGHSVEEKMHSSGGMEIREGLLKDVVETLAPKVITGVSKGIVPELMASVPETVSESLAEILQTYLIEDLREREESTFGASLSVALGEVLAKNSAPEEGRLVAQRVSLSLVHTLTRSLAHTVVPALSQTLSHSPMQDYYCYYCFHKKTYCQYCSYAPAQLYYSMFYAGFYSTYYGDYYSNYFKDPEKLGILNDDDEAPNAEPGDDDPMALDASPDGVVDDENPLGAPNGERKISGDGGVKRVAPKHAASQYNRGGNGGHGGVKSTGPHR